MPPFISTVCGMASKSGEKQNADEISGYALGNGIFKTQVNPLKATLL